MKPSLKGSGEGAATIINNFLSAHAAGISRPQPPARPRGTLTARPSQGLPRAPRPPWRCGLPRAAGRPTCSEGIPARRDAALSHGAAGCARSFVLARGRRRPCCGRGFGGNFLNAATPRRGDVAARRPRGTLGAVVRRAAVRPRPRSSPCLSSPLSLLLQAPAEGEAKEEVGFPSSVPLCAGLLWRCGLNPRFPLRV